jgi:hypothetical protein
MYTQQRRWLEGERSLRRLVAPNVNGGQGSPKDKRMGWQWTEDRGPGTEGLRQPAGQALGRCEGSATTWGRC